LRGYGIFPVAKMPIYLIITAKASDWGNERPWAQTQALSDHLWLWVVTKIQKNYKFEDSQLGLHLARHLN